MLSTPGKQSSGHLQTSGSIENKTDLDTFYLSHTSLYILYILYISYIL